MIWLPSSTLICWKSLRTNLLILKAIGVHNAENCGSQDLPTAPTQIAGLRTWLSLLSSRKGTLYSVTKVYIGQPSMRDYMPLIVGYVDLPEGIRIFAQLQGAINGFSCGDEVELIVGPVRNNNRGEPIVSYKFKKAG